jgi:hypothetical protein
MVGVLALLASVAIYRNTMLLNARQRANDRWASFYLACAKHASRNVEFDYEAPFRGLDWVIDAESTLDPSNPDPYISSQVAGIRARLECEPLFLSADLLETRKNVTLAAQKLLSIAISGASVEFDVQSRQFLNLIRTTSITDDLLT